MTRVNNRKHLDLLGRSFTGNWTKEDNAEVEKGLEGFAGATIARAISERTATAV